MVEISARRPEPLHRSLSLQKLRIAWFNCSSARRSFNTVFSKVGDIPLRLMQPLMISSARNCTWNDSLCFRVCKTKCHFKLKKKIK